MVEKIKLINLVIKKDREDTENTVFEVNNDDITRQ